MTRHRPGRHFLQIPGPTAIPDRVLHAIAKPTIDHRGPEFARLTRRIIERLQRLAETTDAVLLFPSSGTGAWESALVNTLSPGSRVLACETGYFATQWRDLATRLGLEVEWIAGDWRHPVDPTEVEGALRRDAGGRIDAVLVVHNETSTGIRSDVPGVRAAIDLVGHHALLMVDTVSSLGSMPYRHGAWGVDVTIGGSQKGLMLPPGLGLNVVSDRALERSAAAGSPRSYWSWSAVHASNETGYFPYTPPTNLLFGLDVSLDLLLDEGLDVVFARHRRFGEATRRAVRTWGLDLCCLEAAACSDTLTAIWMPEGHDADALRHTILEACDMSLGSGLGKVKGRVVRIGHLGDLNDLTLAGALCGFEMGLGLAGVPHATGGVAAALEYLVATARQAAASSS